MNSIPQHWCPFPFSQMDFDTKGHCAACYRNHSLLGNFNDQSLPEIWNGKQYRTLRKKLWNGEKPTECKSCWDQESAGIKSTRQRELETYKLHHRDIIQRVEKEYDPITGEMPLLVDEAELRFGIICQLRCRHCNTNNSSQWYNLANKNSEVKELFYETGDLSRHKEIRGVEMNQNAVDQIIKHLIPTIKRVRITGGEPLQQPQHLQVIKAMQPYASDIELEYTSNLQSLTFKGEDFAELWKPFKKVLIRISMDGDPSMFEYKRTNANLKIVEQNIARLHEYDNVELQATCTTSIYNITRFDNIIKYFTEIGCFFHASLVQYPDPINIKNLPKDLKDTITSNVLNVNLDKSWNHSIWKKEKNVHKQIARIKEWSDYVIKYMNSDRNSIQMLSKETISYVDRMDKFNGQSFKEVYPEYGKYI